MSIGDLGTGLRPLYYAQQNQRWLRQQACPKCPRWRAGEALGKLVSLQAAGSGRVAG